MKNNKKYIIISAVIVSVITVFAVLMILYDLGYFDISFLKRPEKTPITETETVTETDTEPESTEPDGTDTASETEDLPADPSVFDELHAAIPAVDGTTVRATDKTYDKNTTALYRLDNVELPKKAFADSYMTRTRYFALRDAVLRTFTEKTIKEMRRAVDVYMDYFVIAEDNVLNFYNGSGELVLRYTDEEELVFAYERDKDGKPLFIKDDEYYYIDPGVRMLIKSGYDKSESRGFYYNYPKDFAIDKVKAKFWNYEPVVQRDESGIGSVYFDSGYVMVRNIKYERDDEDKNVVEDMEVIVNEDGREFPLPEGCVAKAYSYQRILVENNGKYGFYAVKNAWIADTKYTYATPFYEGLAVVGNSMQKGVIDMDGNFVIPMSYSYISVCSGGIIVCWSSKTGYEVYIKVEI